MRTVSSRWYYPAELFFALALALWTGVLVVALSDLSTTWLTLLSCALVGTAVMFWAKDVKRVLLLGFALAIPIDIQKSIIPPHARVSPGIAAFPPDVFLAPLLVIWFWHKLVVLREPFRRPLGFWFATAVVGWTWVSAFACDDIHDGVLAAISYTRFYLAYLLIADMVRSAQTFRYVLTAFGAGLVLNLMMAAAQFVTRRQLALQGAKSTSLGVNLVFSTAGVSAFRPSGFFHHPNPLGNYLVFVLPVLMAILFLGVRRVGRNVWSIAAILMTGGLAAMVLTLSRGAWISFGVGSAYFLLVGFRRGLVRHQQIALIVGAVLTAAALVGIAYPTAYVRIFYSDHRSTESRFAMNDQAFMIIRNHPIFGVGVGRYNMAAHTYVPHSYARLGKDYQEYLQKGVVHNTFLIYASEEGIPGVLLMSATLIYFATAFFRVKQWKDPVYCALCLALCSGVLGHTTFYVFDKFYVDVSTLICWTTFGLIAALVRIHEEGEVEPAT